MAFGRKTKGGQILANLSNFEFSGTPGYTTYVKHILHVHDGWIVIYDEEDKAVNYKEERTCYVQAADGHVKWDMINKANI